MINLIEYAPHTDPHWDAFSIVHKVSSQESLPIARDGLPPTVRSHADSLGFLFPFFFQGSRGEPQRIRGRLRSTSRVLNGIGIWHSMHCMSAAATHRCPVAMTRRAGSLSMECWRNSASRRENFARKKLETGLCASCVELVDEAQAEARPRWGIVWVFWVHGFGWSHENVEASDWCCSFRRANGNGRRAQSLPKLLHDSLVTVWGELRRINPFCVGHFEHPGCCCGLTLLSENNRSPRLPRDFGLRGCG